MGDLLVLNSDSNRAGDPAAHHALIHHALIVDQFNRQAATFAERHAQADPLQRLLRSAGVTEADTVLDVACGPGIVACAFASVAQHVTGLDLAPVMLEQARARQAERGLANLTWLCGDVARLPFPDDSFSIVVSRYAFHHFLAPGVALAEMRRVCRPSGRVVVADVTPEAEKLAAYDQFEKLRDPSHAHALSLDSLKSLFESVDLRAMQVESFGLEMDFQDLMSGSFPNPESVERVWQLLRDDLGKDRTGLGAYLKDGKYFVSFPTTIIAAGKAASEGKQ
jgi:ubiquinone/menaquinone biosynthesis C-methylase UbiE